jgi:Fe-S cluster biogenesis protein NfuA
VIDDAELARAVRDVDTRMKGHAGGVELVGTAADGVVELRFTGMCQGCFARPNTFEALIRPRLMRVSGVTDVCASGARLSDEATARLRHLLRDHASASGRVPGAHVSGLTTGTSR